MLAIEAELSCFVSITCAMRGVGHTLVIQLRRYTTGVYTA